MIRTIRMLAIVCLALGMAGIRSATPTLAAGTTVTDCPTTEAALQTDINNAGAGGTVTFTCPTPTTISFGASIAIKQAVTLDGSTSPSPVTFDGGGHSEMFAVWPGSIFRLTGLTLSGGHTTGNGGAIYNTGTLTITGSTLSGNFTSSIYGTDIGGAIYNDVNGTMTVTNSTFAGNSSVAGGAIYNDGTMSITNSTFSTNSASYQGGAIYNGGTATVTNSTLSTNSAREGGPILNYAATLIIGGSILGYNCTNYMSTTTDLGYNFNPDGTCVKGGTGDIQSGPVIDQIPTSYTIPGTTTPLCPSTDQRGFTRPDDSETSCDIGAYESGAILKLTQTITFTSTAPTSAVVHDQYTPTATASSGLTVTFGASGACSYSSGTVTMTGAGTCTVTADQAGNGTYPAAPQVSQSFSVNKAMPVITWTNPADITYGTALSGTQLDASASVPGTFGYSPTSGTVLNASANQTLSVTFTPTDTVNYGTASKSVSINVAQAAATIVLDAGSLSQTYDGTAKAATATTTPAGRSYSVSYTQGGVAVTNPTSAGSYSVTATITDPNYTGTITGTLTIGKADQTISFDLSTLPAKTSADTAFDISSYASGGGSGNAVTFTSATISVCTVSGSEVTIVSIGTCTINADQAGNSNYNFAPQVSQSFTVASPQKTTGMTVATATGTYGGSANLSATLTAGIIPVGGKTIIFSLNGTAVCGVSGMPTCPTTDATTGIATLSGVSLGGMDAGTYANAVSASFAGDSGYVSSSGSNTLTVTPANQTITVTTPAPANKVYNGTFSVAATSDSGLTVTYGSSGGCTNSGATYTMTSGTTACTVTFDQAGNKNYNAATQVIDTVTAAKAAATIALSNLNQTYDGTAKSVTVGTTPSGLSGISVTYTGSSPTSYGPSTTAPTNAGSYSVDASLGNANYTASDATGTLVIAKASQTITFDLSTLPAKTYGNGSFDISSDASGGSSGNAVTFGSGTTSVCTISGSTVTIVSAGTCTINADQAGTSNYTAAPRVSQTFTVGRAPLTITASSPSVTYTGSVPAITPGYGGFIIGESSTSLSHLPTCGSTALTSGAAGSYVTTCSGAVDANYQISYVSGTLTIAQAHTGTSLSSALNPSMSSQSVIFTATLSVTAPGAGTPAGTVDFFDGTTKLGSGPLATSNGVTRATFSTSTLPLGSHNLTATYNGDGNFAGSTSAALTQYVDTNLSGYPKLASGAYNLQNALLPGAYLAYANLAGASAVYVTLTGATLTGANLSGANLSQAKLSNANLSGANLSNAKLTGANLWGANLSNANLSNANLSNANLSNANLSNANLSQTNLTGVTGLSTATLTGVIWSMTTCPDGTTSSQNGGTCIGHL